MRSTAKDNGPDVAFDVTRWGSKDLTAAQVEAHAADQLTRLVVGPASLDPQVQRDDLTASPRPSLPIYDLLPHPSRITHSRNVTVLSGHGRTRRPPQLRSGGPLRSRQDTRGHATKTVRDRASLTMRPPDATSGRRDT